MMQSHVQLSNVQWVSVSDVLPKKWKRTKYLHKNTHMTIVQKLWKQMDQLAQTGWVRQSCKSRMALNGHLVARNTELCSVRCSFGLFCVLPFLNLLVIPTHSLFPRLRKMSTKYTLCKYRNTLSTQFAVLLFHCVRMCTFLPSVSTFHFGLTT